MVSAPPELITLPAGATLGDLRAAVGEAYRTLYPAFRAFQVGAGGKGCGAVGSGGGLWAGELLGCFLRLAASKGAVDQQQSMCVYERTMQCLCSPAAELSLPGSMLMPGRRRRLLSCTPPPALPRSRAWWAG